MSQDCYVIFSGVDKNPAVRPFANLSPTPSPRGVVPAGPSSRHSSSMGSGFISESSLITPVLVRIPLEKEFHGF